MKRARSILIHAPLERVWAIAAQEFAGISAWASNVLASRPLQEADGRVCQTPQGQATERLLHVDPDAHTFTYEIRAAFMPGFVERAVNTWSLTSEGAHQTRLTMEAEMTLSGAVGWLMGWPMRLGMGRLLCDNLEELKHYIEHDGEPHERKRQATLG